MWQTATPPARELFATVASLDERDPAPGARPRRTSPRRLVRADFRGLAAEARRVKGLIELIPHVGSFIAVAQDLWVRPERPRVQADGAAVEMEERLRSSSSRVAGPTISGILSLELAMERPHYHTGDLRSATRECRRWQRAPVRELPLIYPEGTRFSDAKRVRVLERLARAGDAKQFAYARASTREPSGPTHRRR